MKEKCNKTVLNCLKKQNSWLAYWFCGDTNSQEIGCHFVQVWGSILKFNQYRKFSELKISSNCLKIKIHGRENDNDAEYELWTLEKICTAEYLGGSGCVVMSQRESYPVITLAVMQSLSLQRWGRPHSESWPGSPCPPVLPWLLRTAIPGKHFTCTLPLYFG